MSSSPLLSSRSRNSSSPAMGGFPENPSLVPGKKEEQKSFFHANSYQPLSAAVKPLLSGLAISNINQISNEKSSSDLMLETKQTVSACLRFRCEAMKRLASKCLAKDDSRLISHEQEVLKFMCDFSSFMTPKDWSYLLETGLTIRLNNLGHHSYLSTKIISLIFDVIEQRLSPEAVQEVEKFFQELPNNVNIIFGFCQPDEISYQAQLAVLKKYCCVKKFPVDETSNTILSLAFRQCAQIPKSTLQISIEDMKERVEFLCLEYHNFFDGQAQQNYASILKIQWDKPLSAKEFKNKVLERIQDLYTASKENV